MPGRNDGANGGGAPNCKIWRWCHYYPAAGEAGYMSVCVCVTFLCRCQRLGYCSSAMPTLAEMFNEADESLFTHVLTNRSHVLQSHLPDRSSSQYNLRKGAHDKELITKTSQLNERDFIMRMLYKNCY